MKSITRRNFVKWGTVAAVGTAALAGFTGCATDEDSYEGDINTKYNATGDTGKGEWKTGSCHNNCSCTSSRCLLRVYVEDGVPIRMITDEDEYDTYYTPQRRACPRGRARISNVLSPARNKYPMKRKNWSPDDPHGELRGRDEWERITWDEALDYIADELKKVLDKYGTRGILDCGYALTSATYFETTENLMNYLGGALHHDFGTVSLGSWPVPEFYMTGSFYNAPDVISLAETDMMLLFGCNWVANKGGNWGYWLNHMRKSGIKIIIIDPWLNQTAQPLADEWVGILPGTDTALCLGMAYHQIEHNLQNQEFLDKYCIGFDAEHMPEDADPKGNFKDYILGTYDGEPKTPEWAEAICGVPADDIRSLAEEIANTEKVYFFAGQSTTKIQAGEMFAQAFYTLAFMHGVGTPGNFATWTGLHEGMTMSQYVSAGDFANNAENPKNPLTPPSIMTMPDWSQITDWDSWDRVEFSECWQSILDGAYGRDEWPGGKKPLDIHLIYTGGSQNSLNSLPHTNAGIEVFRKADFVYGADPFFNPSQQHCDIVLPVVTWWEKEGIAWTNSGDSIFWNEKIMEPLFEARDEFYIAGELAKRLGVDESKINNITYAGRGYSTVSGAKYMVDLATGEYKTLFTLTQEDIDSFGVEGEPQEGLISFQDFKKKGIFKAPREEGDKLMDTPWADFIADPEANPLATTSGKFDIYSETLAEKVNSIAFSHIEPIAKWQYNPGQGVGAQTDEYPLLLWTPHTLRRAHTCNDPVISLRQAFPQACYMSTVDADERGIKNDDTVLMTSPYGKVLRHAKLMPTIKPGCVAMEDGAWFEIDEETGIDLGGNPNILQAPAASGQGVQAWTGTIVQVEKYTGDLQLPADMDRPLVMPVGIEE